MRARLRDLRGADALSLRPPPAAARESEAGDLRFDLLCGGILLAALVVRVGYVLAQPLLDPTFANPMLDGLYYLEWARSVRGEGTFAGALGAYYLAPLYPWLLALLIEVTGDQVALIYLIQHAGVVVAAWLLGLAARRFAGEWAGLGTMAFVVGYHPAMFFASSPLGEWLGLLLLAAAVLAGTSAVRFAAAGAGLALGLASLARPNLLLVAAAWVVVELVRRRPGRAALLAATVALTISPVTIRNWVVSGHPVPISANAGMTLYHGNSPWADGIGVLPPGFSGSVANQRAESTREASRRVGLTLDAVDADRYWGREALRARLQDPWGTVRLVARRLMLTVSNEELGLDYSPALDPNPWRRLTPVPFALLVGLAAAGLVSAGWRGTGGWLVWSAIAASAVAPVAFYVSSRYRLPLAFMLALPAGVGLAALLSRRSPRRLLAAGLALVLAVASFAMPTSEERRITSATGHANRGVAWKQAGDLVAAEADMRRALEIDDRCAGAWFGLGVLQDEAGRAAEASLAYERALAVRPSMAAATCNLARLRILGGLPREALGLARGALDYVPDEPNCWAQLVTATYLEGGLEAGRRAVGEARRAGVELRPDLLGALERLGSTSGEQQNGGRVP